MQFVDLTRNIKAYFHNSTLSLHFSCHRRAQIAVFARFVLVVGIDILIFCSVLILVRYFVVAKYNRIAIQQESTEDSNCKELSIPKKTLKIVQDRKVKEENLTNNEVGEEESFQSSEDEGYSSSENRDILFLLGSKDFYKNINNSSQFLRRDSFSQ